MAQRHLGVAVRRQLAKGLRHKQQQMSAPYMETGRIFAAALLGSAAVYSFGNFDLCTEKKEKETEGEKYFGANLPS